MQTLKQLRQANNATQKQCADILKISLRSYKSYENCVDKQNTLKYEYLLEKLDKHFKLDENCGVLSVKQIKEICTQIFEQYDIEYCYLFGSYAKGNATKTSDIDLLISTQITGIKFFGLMELLRENLHKKIDLLTVSELDQNPELLNEILKYGVKIYG